MGKNTPLAWDLRPFDPPRDLRPAAHLKCGFCPEVGKVLLAGPLNPERVTKWFIRLGWEVDQHNQARCFCKKCVTNRKIRAQEEAEERKTKVPPPGLVAAQRQQALSPPQERKMSGPRTEVGIKALTADQKTALRNELGGTFDDENGRYIEGNSDRAISEKLNIPMTIVIEFRENFYGELRGNPEFDALRLQLEDAKKFARNFQASLERIEDKIKELEKKAGP